MLVKLEQPKKQEFSNDVTEDGIVTLVKLIQLRKHSFPKEVTEDGIVILVKLEHQ